MGMPAGAAGRRGQTAGGRGVGEAGGELLELIAAGGLEDEQLDRGRRGALVIPGGRRSQSGSGEGAYATEVKRRLKPSGAPRAGSGIGAYVRRGRHDARPRWPTLP
jgi:hypothetical protein